MPDTGPSPGHQYKPRWYRRVDDLAIGDGPGGGVRGDDDLRRRQQRHLAATYPASYPTCMAVAATTNQDQRAAFSSFGPWVDVAAPGAGILSTLKGGGYDLMSGTSMAAPHVAGLAGLLRSRGVVTERDAVRSRIEATADRIQGAGPPWTRGRINACRAMTNTPSC